VELADLNKLKVFPSTYPTNQRRFYSPADGDAVHYALCMTLESAEHSLVVAMYGYDDPDIDSILKAKAERPEIYFQMALDKTQAAGKHERELLAAWGSNQLGNSIAIGHSERGAIQHMKAVVVDGRFIIDGSTNWSASGETLQDNQLTITDDAVAAAELTSRINIIHDRMLAAQNGVHK
jgi:phosphatidylserine/phosphatidylglycerophosphate/cardiolipin synthase-like enzyme